MGKESLGIIGSSGLVGKVVTEKMCTYDTHKILTPSKKEVDITYPKSIEKWIEEYKPKSLLLLVAYTEVDKAQTQEGKRLANLINREGIRTTAQFAKRYGIKLFYISTDFVFTGSDNRPGPYSPKSIAAEGDSLEIGEYARSKLMGEKEVRKSGCDYAIIRISYPFGNPNSPKDLVRKTIDRLEKGNAFFSDQQITPTYIPDLATGIEIILEKNLKGIFHVVCWPPTTPAKFAKYIAIKHNLDVPVKEISIEKFLIGRDKNNIAPRPILGGLIPSPEIIGRRNWKEAVDEFFLKL